MKKEIFYLIGAVAGALLVLLAVPLGNAYIGNYLSVYGGMDTQSYVLLMQSAVTAFRSWAVFFWDSSARRIFSGANRKQRFYSRMPRRAVVRRGISHRALWGISFHVLRGEFPSTS